MVRVGRAIAILVLLLGIPRLVLAQAVVSNVNALRTQSSGWGGNAYLFLQNYYAPGGGGGGVLIGSGHNGCQIGVPSSNWSSGSTTIDVDPNVGFPAGIALGMGISGTGIQPGTNVQAYAVGTPYDTITLSIATLAMGSDAKLSGDNGGTAFNDINSNCFTRLSQTYSQAEWGAYGDYGSQNHNDTFPLQNWMNAPQPHIAVPGNSMITAPLVCNDGGIIQGSPTAGVAEDPGILPTFVITAAPGTVPTPFAGQAMLVMSNAGGAGGANNARCAIHGVGLIASSPASGAGVYDTVDMLGTGDTIDQHSYLAGGYYNVKAAGEGTGQHNVEIYDSSLNNSVSDNLHIVSSNNKIVRNSFAGAGGNNIDFSDGGDTLISDNIIQQANGWGVSIHDSAIVVRIGTNLFDNDGKGIAGTGALQIKNSDNMTVCNNTFARSAAATEAGVPVPSQYAASVYFSGIDDGVSLCGNVYRQSFNPPKPGALSTTYDAIMLRPDYDYDVGPGSTLTNVTIADNPAPQNIGVCSPNALLVLNCPNTTQPPQNNLPAPNRG